VDLVLTSSLCIALSRLGTGEQGGARLAAQNALKGVASNPMPWAILSGAVLSWLGQSHGLQLPAPLMQTIGLLADSASPVALFTIGAVLARSQMTCSDPTPWIEYVPVALKKLLLHPLLVMVMGSSAIALGVPLGRFELSVLVLVAALPSASNVSLLAEKFGANNGRIARIILVSTVLAFFTFAAAVSMVTGHG
jgi:malonate transporter and related proteins